MRLSVSVPRRPLRSLAILLATVLSLSVLMAVAPASTATAADPRLPSTIEDGGFIISDAEYFNGGSMTAAQAQTFLEARVPSCKATSGPTCLRNFTADIPAKAKDAYCAAIPKKTKVRAAEIIVTVGKACGLSPKVILVMLQKEQGLVTSTKPSEWSYRAAMGMNCPDTAPCSAASAGFFNQVYLGARQQQVYANNPTKYGYRKGQVATVKWHPNSACGTSKVLIKNQATANLYIYTPYRPNMAALAAGYATGDSCSSYGNRNFYNYYVQWFAPEVNRWGSGAAARVDACTAPKTADIVPASSVATVTAATTARKAPSTLCAAGSSSVAKSAKVTVTGTYGSWARATVGSTSMWIAKSALSIASGTPAGNPCAVPAESSVTKAGGTITVVSENLRARKAPSLDCATGFRWITAGQKYERTGIYGAWWRIQVAGSTYWSHSDYMTVEEKPPAKTMYLATTTNMTPSVSSSTIQATLRKGTTVKALSVSGDRTQITVGGMTGWVFSSKLSTKNPGAVGGQDRQVIASTPLRATASASGKVLSTLKAGTKVTVHDTFGAWRAVTAGSTKGWMRDAELQVIAKTMYLSAPDNVASSATSTTIMATLRKGTAVTASTVSGNRTQITVDGITGWVTTSKLVAKNPGTVAGQDRQSIASTPLRATASASGKVLTTLKAGTKVTIHDGYGIWRAVTAGSTKGWMRDSELKAVSAPPTAKTMYLATTTNMTPSVSSATIQATLRKGTTVKALSVSGDRTQITVDGMTGWVFTSKLSTKNPGAISGQDRQVIASTPLRATASASGKVLSTLKAGAKVTVHDTFGIWRAVTAGSTRGWMRDSELKAVLAPPAAKTMYLATTTNMTPSVSSKAIQATLRKGTTVKALSVSGDRTQITVDGMTGWVFTSKLSTKNPGAVGGQDRQVIASTPLRATASASGKVLSTLKAGTKVTVHDTFGIWRAVTAGSTKGWMRDSELKKLTAAPATSVKTTTSALNLRQTPSTSGKILVVIPKGTKVTTTASSGIWRKTSFQGKTGWVSSDFLR
ncbi:MULTISPECIES: SH3 domain-containing protein [unclassified Microbacterium]|uniref:SH3 domain-containing protein n=1 Tax=unclassified Microbacterium TaxID=2609290 RepID=UPI003C2F142D